MMKSFFKKLAFVMALAMVVSMAAPAATASAAEELKIAYQNGSAITELNIAKVDGTEDLRFLGAKTMKSVVWESDNTSVATVDKNGIVTAKADGTANITVTVDGLSATVKVYCVTPSENKATIGSQDGTERSMSKHTMKVGEEFDFRFFGIKDYDAKRYDCTWLSLTPDVADVDKSGNVTAKAEGTAAITLSVTNKVIGKTYVVAPVVITVEAEATPTPAAEPALVIDQKTEVSFNLTFKDMNVDVENLKKNEIEVYNVQKDEATGIEHLYIWQISSISVVKDMEDTILVKGYTTNELVDEYDYVVKYVVPNADEELVKEIASETFTASVGEVVRMETTYKTYKNNQNYYTWEGVAYTTCGEGEDIETKIYYTLYDDEGVNVTGHYLRANYNKDLVTIELVTEEAEDIFELNENNNTLKFEDVWEDPYVVFDVVYDDNEDVKDTIKMNVKEAPAYKIANIDDWQINITEYAQVKNDKDYLKQWVALYDDYDVDDMDPYENHEIVLWFTDNYGNKYVTDSHFTKYKDTSYEYIEGSEKFVSEGYALYFESKSPQVLVVGDDEDDATTSSIITTKKTGTATVNVTLRNSDDETIDRVATLKIQVKAPRYVKSVSTADKKLGITTDSIPVITENTIGGHTFTQTLATDVDTRTGDSNRYDTDFTYAETYVFVTDNHGANFGIYNDSLFAELTVSVEATNIKATAFNSDDAEADYYYYADKSGSCFILAFDGVDVMETLIAAGDTEAKRIDFEIVATDDANEKEVDTTFKLAFQNPDHDKVTGDIITDSKLVVSAKESYGYVSTKWLEIPINVFETSNGYNVNYADNIELITTQARYDELFKNKTAATTTDALYIAVFGPKAIVGEYTADTNDDTDDFGIEQLQSGEYIFHYADTKQTDRDDDNDGTRFATAGSYRIELIKVTKTSTKNGEYVVSSASTKTKKFKLVDDRFEFIYHDQSYIYVDDEILDGFEGDEAWENNGADSIQEIAADAFTYWNVDWDCKASIGAWNDETPVMSEIGGVRYTVNEKANSVVLKDVFLKVKINVNKNKSWTDDGDVWYYVEVEIPDGKTVELESSNLVDEDDSVDYRKDPDGRKVQ